MNKRLQEMFKDHIDNGTNPLLYIDLPNRNKYETKVGGFLSGAIMDNTTGDSKIQFNNIYSNSNARYFDVDENNFITYNPEGYIKSMNNDYYRNFICKWERDNDIQRVCISHKNCHDGLGVKAVVNYHNKDRILNFHGLNFKIEYIELDYDGYDFYQLCKDLQGKIVYVGDFSFKKKELDILISVTDMILINDHHLGAFNSDIADYDNVNIDMGYSGAMLAWKFFYMDKNEPMILSLIEDRDLWNWFYGDLSKACHIAIKREGEEFLKDYVNDDGYRNSSLLKQALKPYVKEVRQLEESYEKMAKTAKPYTIADIPFHGLNIRSGVSEVCNLVSRMFNTPSFAYWEDEDGKMQISFRNATDDVDVNAIAKMFGGGGHKQASGCKINYTDINLNTFFRNKILDVEYDVKGAKLDLFHKHGISPWDYVSTANCMRVCAAENKTFEELFIVTKDEDLNLHLLVRKDA